MPTAQVNGANIYYEMRGSGPPLLIVCGAFADVSHFERVAELLANAFTVVTYDRRGNSRSDGLEPGTPTTADEQADDAAELLRALGLVPAAVHGNSSGAIIALSLMLRHPEVVSAATLHEPPLAGGMSDPAAVGAALGQLVEQGMTAGGPPVAAEHFLRFAMSDASWEALPEDVRERARANGPLFFGSELGQVDAYDPPLSALKANRVPARVLVSTDGIPFCKEVCPWLSEQLGVPLVEVPGTHTPQLDRPEELAAAMRESFTAVS